MPSNLKKFETFLKAELHSAIMQPHTHPAADVEEGKSGRAARGRSSAGRWGMNSREHWETDPLAVFGNTRFSCETSLQKMTYDEMHNFCLQTEVHDPQEWPPQKPQTALALFA